MVQKFCLWTACGLDNVLGLFMFPEASLGAKHRHTAELFCLSELC